MSSVLSDRDRARDVVAPEVVPVARSGQDAWITTARRNRRLMTTDGLRTSDLNIDTENGVVTLHGLCRARCNARSNRSQSR